ncbi:MAG: adenylate/guanylate cyclase domain-containing protein [Geminicoccaceae bacterium]
MNDMVEIPQMFEASVDRTGRRISVRILLVVAITALVLLGALSVTVLHAVQFSRHAEAEAARTLDAAAHQVRAQAEAMFAPAVTIVRHMVRLSGDVLADTSSPTLGDAFDSFVKGVEAPVEFTPHISTAYVGYADGSMVVLARNNQILRNILKLPESASSAPLLRGERDNRAGLGSTRWSWRDEAGWETVKRPPMDYDPRERPWYRLGMDTDGPVWTGLYRSNVEGDMRITLASALSSASSEPRAVLGVDIALNDLIAFFRDLEVSANGVAFIAKRNGGLLAHPALDPAMLEPVSETAEPTLLEISHPSGVDLSLFEAFGRDDALRIELEHGGETVLGRRFALRDLIGIDAYLYVAAPLSDFTRSADRALRSVLVLTGVITLAVIAVGVLIARAVAEPVVRATETMASIARLDTTKPATPEHSVLAEIDTLNKSVASMHAALKSFSRYVPKELVRELLDLKQPLRLGGRRREITVLFTDIEDFTSWSETEQYERMVDGLADYFDVLSNAIAEHGGTVDKFLGDGVMAIWGAPRFDPDHTCRACDAVIDIARRLDALNERRLACGERPLKTRFGLHRGYAFVGNVGAHERFGYTALGDVVNTAARLEKANKDLGSEVLVSRAIAANAGPDHQFTPKGEVCLKGKTSVVDVFELELARDKSSPPRLQLVASA